MDLTLVEGLAEPAVPFERSIRLEGLTSHDPHDTCTLGHRTSIRHLPAYRTHYASFSSSPAQFERGPFKDGSGQSPGHPCRLPGNAKLMAISGLVAFRRPLQRRARNGVGVNDTIPAVPIPPPAC